MDARLDGVTAANALAMHAGGAGTSCGVDHDMGADLDVAGPFVLGLCNGKVGTRPSVCPHDQEPGLPLSLHIISPLKPPPTCSTMPVLLDSMLASVTRRWMEQGRGATRPVVSSGKLLP